MAQADIIIIGAGAAGLMAAMLLCRAGKKVIVLEANNRTGGRIHTIQDIPGTGYIEMGAEFVHGDLPVTLATLKEAGIGYRPSGGKMWQAKNGKLTQENRFIEEWGLFEEKLKQLDEDMPLNAFLDKYFGDSRYEGLKTSVRRYAAGYDTADPDRASAIALRKEWIEDNEGEQHRVDGGYIQLINYLAEEIEKHDGTIITGTIVKEIQWQKDKTTIRTANNTTYSASKCIIAVSLGVLQASEDALCSIACSPALPNHAAAIQSMGMGSVIKILLVFKEAFWKNKEIVKNAAGDINNMAFLFSGQEIPTWWTQYPDDSPVLTGWLGGPEAAAFKNKTDEEILAIAKTGLAAIFNITVAEIEKLLVSEKIGNWPADPYTLGSYSYATVATEAALKLFNTPVMDTLYFAGEAYYADTVMGTVEAALASGKQVADRINSEDQ